LIQQAQDLDIPAFNGLKMLVAQAKKSAECFTDTLIPDEEIERIVSKVARQSLNIVLIGMPGCGKTSIGDALAKKTGREFIDTDELIAQTAEKPISAIFAEDGEEKFRALETGVLQSVCKQSGKVIATGGGIVTRNENRHVIRQNGIVVFIERDVSVLPVDGRPLSQRNGIETLAVERLPLYRKWSDCAVQNSDIEQTAADIWEMFESNVTETVAVANTL
jgi:shikimate dehydrogenase